MSRLLFDQSLTAQTLGVGEDYQSHNPTYDWTLQALPRYYFIDEERWSYNVQANLSIAQELTNSDETTQRSEVDFNDTVLLLRYDRTLYEKDGYETLLGFSFPEVTLPTSRASRNNGRILGLGVSVIPIQVLPLQSGPWLSSLVLAPIAGYHHYFTEATVPTNDDVGRVRTDVDGKSVVSDQLSDSAYAKHETRFGVGAQLSIHERVLLATDFQWRPTWNYQFDDDVEVCNLLTGCAEVDGVDNPEAYELVTVFLSELAVQVIDELSLTAGYVNLANATGPDGQHRSMFYSPNARIYLTATAFLSEIFDKQADEKFRVTRTKTAAAPKRAVVY